MANANKKLTITLVFDFIKKSGQRKDDSLLKGKFY